MNIQSKDALEITRDNMRDYGKYVSQGRSYPCIYDGLKTSYKRAIYGMHINNTHKVVKVAELAAFALPYHPHPTSVSGVIVSMGDADNKLKLMETQGNWGASEHGVLPSADRYIGGYLSELAEMLMCDSVKYSNFVKGEIEKDEPEALPSLLPICFINGLKGIPSGLPTLNVPTIDPIGMIDYYIDILQHKNLNYVPTKLPKPNLGINIVSTQKEWENLLLTGKGSIRVAPVMSIDSNNVITITALPSSKDIESVRKIIEKELFLDKIDVRDESTEDTRIVIEKVPYKQCNMKDIYDRLYNKLQYTETYNMAFFDSEKIYVPCAFDKVVKANLTYLINTHKNRIEHQLIDLEFKLKVLDVINSFSVGGIVKKLSELSYEEATDYLIKKFKIEKKVATTVLQKPLSYLTKEHNSEYEQLTSQINALNADRSDIYECLIKRYYEIKKPLQAKLKHNKKTAFVKSKK